jgi:hypothetical protein
MLISTNNQRRFSILVENSANSTAIINLLTRAGISSLQFQNQIVNDEDKSAGKVYGCRGGVLQGFE